MREAREGAQAGHVTYPEVKRTPPAAKASRLGVGISLQPWNPTPAYPKSSARMTITLGFSWAGFPAASP
jgi:hypothetical protein